MATKDKTKKSKEEVTLETEAKTTKAKAEKAAPAEVLPTAKEVKKSWKIRHQKYYEEHMQRVNSLNLELKGTKISLENIYNEMKQCSDNACLIKTYVDKAESTLIINENFSYDVLKKNKKYVYDVEIEKLEQALEKVVRKSKTVEQSVVAKKAHESEVAAKKKIYDEEMKEFEKLHGERLARINQNNSSLAKREFNDLINLVDEMYKSVLMNINDIYKLAVEQEKRAYTNVFEKGVHPNSEGKIIELNNVIKYFTNGDTVSKVLKGVTVSIDEGDFLVILGPSGSGKTTTLNITSGLDSASEGEVIVAGHNLIYLSDKELTSFRARYISFIFQQYNLLPTLTVLENIKTGEELQKDKSKRIDLSQLVKDLGLEENIKKYPYQLSGGQQQRVAIGRALAKNPKILFADEPTGALDEETSRKILELLVDVNKKYKTTLVVVTHNPQIAKIADKVIRFKNGHIEKFSVNKTPLKPSELIWEV